MNGGWSLEQIDPQNYCGEASNWSASTDLSGGTPGRKNSIYAPDPDLTAPILLRAVVNDNRTLTLYFSESMNSNRMNELSRYTASGNLGHPITATPTAPAYKSVVLMFADTIGCGANLHH